MPKPILEALPREIRDQIYTLVLASPSGVVSLLPWTADVPRSLRLLRTCKQIHRECKDIIWQHNRLTLREPTELFQRLNASAKRKEYQKLREISISVEVLDRDELEWIMSGLSVLAGLSRTGRLKRITIWTANDRPRCMEELVEFLNLRDLDRKVDGRLFSDDHHSGEMLINSIWPPFAPWGKSNWLRTMLLDPTGLYHILKVMHDLMGGELWVDDRLCFKEHIQTAEYIVLNPRDGKICICFDAAAR